MRNSDNGMSVPDSDRWSVRVHTASRFERVDDQLRLVVIIYSDDGATEYGSVRLTLPAADPVLHGVGLSCVAIKAVVSQLQQWADRPIDIGACLACVTEAGESEPAKE